MQPIHLTAMGYCGEFIKNSTIRIFRDGDLFQLEMRLSEAYCQLPCHIQIPSKNIFYFIHPILNFKAAAISSEVFSAAGVVNLIFLKPDGQHKIIFTLDIDKNLIIYSDPDFKVDLLYCKNKDDSGLLSLESLKNNILSMRSNWTSLEIDSHLACEDSVIRIPMPDHTHRQRIASHVAREDVSGSIFYKSGRLGAHQISRIANVYGLSPQDSIFVMDWGVGCGRIARHLPESWRKNFFGIDVDPINIKWCQKNMGFGNYRVVQPCEKDKIGESFDLIYSYSVMTHLVDSDQKFWLEKLAQAINPNGLLIISVHGLNHACNYDWSSSPFVLGKFLKNGMLRGAFQNTDIADVTPPGYYTDVSNTPFHILEKWSDIVDIVDILPSGFLEHDVVIARSKKNNAF